MQLNKFRLGMFLTAVAFAVIMSIDTNFGFGFFQMPGWIASIAFVILFVPAVYIYIKVSEIHHFFIKPRKIFTAGIYAVARHPREAGIMFFALPAFWVLTRARLMFFGILACILIWYFVVLLEERDFAKEHRKYFEYRKKTPMLIPKKFTSALSNAAVPVI